MPNLEPTYLRYVYDSLNKGSLNAENAAALPRGFIGLYEQEFTQKTPVDKRKKVLNQLALWALFKGPVSVKLAAAVLELEEEPMKDLVDTYSSWFNSPESGKYQLYHERLRVYLLQKLKADEVQALNEQLISFLEDAIIQAKGDEDEYYALAHLHQHMALESQLGNHYDRLHSYVNQESLWKRQIQLSKGYAWSQNAVQQGIKEGARRNHEMNTIRSTVNSVKLMTQEQNSAEDILNLLNEGDYSTALKRAATWEGERQFKLYLLFIHELTIGNSKKADFRKEACKAVLEAIDQTPEDHSVLDWCKFYPELAIYKYHEELLKMELDGLVIWKRTIHNENLLNELSSLKLFKNNKVKESLSLISKNSNNYYVSKYYNNISEESIFNNNLFDAREYIEKSLNYARKIEDALKRDPRIASICKTLVRLGLKKESKNLLKGIKSPFFIKGELTIMNSFSKISIDNGDIVGSLEYHDKIDKNYLGRMNSLLYIYDRIVDKELAYDKLNILSKMSNLINEVNEIIKVETKEKTIWKRSPVFVPSFHVYNGLYLKRKGDEDSAHQEFESALSLVKNMKREGSILPSYLKLRSIFLEFSDHKRASEVMDIAYSFYATIGDENKNKIKAFDQLISIEVENNKIDSALKLIQNTNIGSCKENGFQKLGQILSFMDLQNFLNHFTIGEYSNFLINGFSKKLLSSSKFNLEINPYLHNYSENTQNLSNILFHKAKMACFFEEERNEEKLNMLSEVLDIKDWRMMSA